MCLIRDCCGEELWNGFDSVPKMQLVLYLIVSSSPSPAINADENTVFTLDTTPKNVALILNAPPAEPAKFLLHTHVHSLASALEKTKENRSYSDAPGTVMLPELHDPSHRMTFFTEWGLAYLAGSTTADRSTKM